MTVPSLVAVVAPRKHKIIKNGLNVFEKGENWLQKYTLSVKTLPDKIFVG